MAESKCSVDHCGKSPKSRGYCDMHYSRWRKTGSAIRECLTCGEEIATRGSAKYCGEKCRPRCKVAGCEAPYRSRDGYCARHKALVRNNGVPTGVREWTATADKYKCLACGAIFAQGEGSGRQFCSSKCSGLYRTYGENIPPANFSCIMCGEHFERDRWKCLHVRSDKKLCDRCRKSKQKRHKSSVGYLALRDGLDCGICGEAVDMSLKHPDRMSPSVDHIVPVACGGDNDESNLQLSHLVCNVTKQAREGFSIVR
jgi:hypothetical protein